MGEAMGDLMPDSVGEGGQEQLKLSGAAELTVSESFSLLSPSIPKI